jgi:uncharacterized membrane protein YuzA (DUF378 family)
MFLVIRILIVLVALPIIAFCMFGVLATFEPPGSVAWRIAYIIIGLGCVAVATWALTARRWRR